MAEVAIAAESHPGAVPIMAVPAEGNLAEVAIERELLTSGLGAAESRAGAVPIIDMSDDDGRIAAAMWRAASDVGFFTLVNHGLDQSAIDAVFEKSERFFAQPRAAKEAQSPWLQAANAGYEFMTQVRPSTGTADQKESL
jgi:hypothetical protein